MADFLSDLFHPLPARRQQALSQAASCSQKELPTLIDALREVALFDEHGLVRGAAVEQLGRFDDPRALFALGMARRDPLPSVRQAACQATARHGDRDHGQKFSELALGDSHWQVRRAAVATMLACADQDLKEQVPALRQVLLDPFWRVRHRAVKALFVIGQRQPELRSLILQPIVAQTNAWAAQQAIEYLRLQWSEAAPAPALLARDPGPAPMPENMLNDPDPAVVTRSLIEDDAETFSTRSLCQLLANSHEALRQAVANILCQRPPETLTDMLVHLERPGLPHALDGCLSVLAHIDQAPLLRTVVKDCSGHKSGALVWAIEQSIQRRDESSLSFIQEMLKHDTAKVRSAAIMGLGEWYRVHMMSAKRLQSALKNSLLDDHPEVQEAALSAAAKLPRELLAELKTGRAFESQSPQARCAWLRTLATEADIEDATKSDDPWVSAAAFEILTTAEGESAEAWRDQAWRHSDPWIKQLGLSFERALQVVLEPASPTLQARALSLVLRHSSELSEAQRLDLALSLSQSPNLALRARATKVLQVQRWQPDDKELEQLLRLSVDPEELVRISTRDLLDSAPSLTSRLKAFIQARPWTESNTPALKAAWGLLAASGDSDSPELLRSGIESAPTSELRNYLECLGLMVFDDPDWMPSEPTGSSSKVQAAIQTPSVELRPLGQSGVEVTPLILSGAQNLAYKDYLYAAEQGVNTMFWEPQYQNLGRFLKTRRGQSVQVVAGSFHAHESGICEDLERACRRLRRSQIDVFLLFWARSEARLDDRSHTLMQALKREGRVRAVGFSTHNRELALKAVQEQDWDLLMTRHSGAHCKGERALFPAVAAHKMGLLTFTNTCYGRMLRPSREHPERPALTASECYRYSLSQPGVSACLTAPRRFGELQDNLEALRQPTLSLQDQARVRQHGLDVYREDKEFNSFIRAPQGLSVRQQALLFLEQHWSDQAAPSEGRHQASCSSLVKDSTVSTFQRDG